MTSGMFVVCFESVWLNVTTCSIFAEPSFLNSLSVSLYSAAGIFGSWTLNLTQAPGLHFAQPANSGLSTRSSAGFADAEGEGLGDSFGGSCGGSPDGGS